MDKAQLMLAAVVITLIVNFIHLLTAIAADNLDEVVSPSNSAATASVVSAILLILLGVALSGGAK